MGDLTISCPKCGGHVAYPKEIAGQAAACPHCQQPIVLGPKSRALLWTVVGIATFCAVVGLAALFWHLGKTARSSQSAPQATAATTKVFEKKETEPAAEPTASENDKAIAALCRAFYERSDKKDFEGVHQLLATPCKAVVTPSVLEKSLSQGFSFRFLGIDSITYPAGPSGTLAKARVRRMALSATSEAEGIREFKCIKESDGWKLFRNFEWTDQIIAEFARSGFSEALRTKVRAFCASNPFDKWPSNETNAFEKMYTTANEGAKEVFPWQVSFAVQTNYIDGWMLKLAFSVHNNADHVWENPGLDLDLKQGGKVVLNDFALLPNVGPGSELSREASFILKDTLQQNTHYDLDVSYTLGRQKCKLASDIPVDFKVQKLTESVKVEVVRKSFETTKNTAGADMLVARVDYRVKNVSKEPLKTVQLKFAWSSLNGELLDQTTEYVVGFSDLPLAPQQTKSGFANCGVGYSNRRVPVKVDIYLEDGDHHWPLYKGIPVQ